MLYHELVTDLYYKDDPLEDDEEEEKNDNDDKEEEKSLIPKENPLKHKKKPRFSNSYSRLLRVLTIASFGSNKHFSKNINPIEALKRANV